MAVNGVSRADYGKNLISNSSKSKSKNYKNGKGYSITELIHKPNGSLVTIETTKRIVPSSLYA